MLTTLYYSLAIAAYSIFLIQFLVAVLGGSDLDMDIDFDGDGVGDLSWGDIFSFKGVIHFLMGFAGWLSLTSYTSTVVWYDYLIALAFGIVFVLALFYLGLLLLKLKQEPTGEKSKDFVGAKGTITIVCKDEPGYYYVTLFGHASTELKVRSEKHEYNLGDEVVIQSYVNEQFYI